MADEKQKTQPILNKENQNSQSEQNLQPLVIELEEIKSKIEKVIKTAEDISENNPHENTLDEVYPRT